MNLSRDWIRLLFWVFIGMFLAATHLATAENDRLLIVEVQIAAENAFDDFIKIYNPSDSDIFLGNYKGSYLRLVKRTKSSAKDYSIKSWSKDSVANVPAKGFFLWASSKNESFPAKIKADSQTSQTLSKDNGVALRIGPENTGELIDSVGWGNFNNILFENASFYKNPGAGQILSRKENNGIYQDTNNNEDDFYLKTKDGFYPKTEENSALENTVPPDMPAETKTETGYKKEQTTQDTITPAEIKKEIKQYPNGVIFSEILPSPKGPDETEEWIEIFNKNDLEVSLSGWKIKDTAGGIKTYVFPENSKINARGYFVLKRTDSKITLNNDGDGLELIKPNNIVADKITFGKSPVGASFNLTDSDWQWSSVLTPESQNIIQLINLNKTDTAKTEESKNFATEKSLASAGQPFRTNEKIPLSLFLAALFLAVASATGILFLKRKIMKQA